MLVKTVKRIHPLNVILRRILFEYFVNNMNFLNKYLI